MTDEISSPLLKSALLAANSSYFPLLVQAAAARQEVPYSGDMLRHVAATPAVVDAITITEEGAVDAALRGMGSDLDALIVAAAADYTPPTEGA